MRPLKIDLVVHGRFHAFDLARELRRLGHDVLIYTNYPKSIVARFGIPGDHVRSFMTHGIAKRVHDRIGLDLERYFHTSFGNWAAQNIRSDSDLTHGFSGIMEEILQQPRSAYGGTRWLVRGSAHIREQHRLLVEEEARLDGAIERPSQWIIDREEREYGLADRIVVLSTFAKRSFVERGVSPEKLLLLKLGVETKRFRPTAKTLEDRCRRIECGRPLRALTVGSFSGRKGSVDLVEIARALRGIVQFTFVGDIGPDSKSLAKEAAAYIQFLPRVAQFDLPTVYNESDVFIFPTIEDGFAAVLAQATAAGLPILTTRNCSGPDIIAESETGWVLPIREPTAFIDRLLWCDENRTALADIVRAVHTSFWRRDWTDMACELVGHLERTSSGLLRSKR